MAEAFEPTLVGLDFREYEAEQRSPDYQVGALIRTEKLHRTEALRERLLKEIGCGKRLNEDAASLLMTEALDALDDCEKLYRCLKLTVDRSPKLTPLHKLHKLLSKFRKQVEVARNDVGKLLRNNDALAYADEFKVEGDPPETSGDDMIILYGPLLRSIGQDLRALSEYLEPHAVRLASVPMGPGRGRPRKYSLGFAILRLAQIYNRFGAGHPKPAVSLTMLPTVKYGGPFFRFASGFLSSVDGASKANTDQAFGDTVQEILKVWKRDQDLHLLVRKQAQTNDIVKFVRTYDRIRTELGLVQQQ